ncbi:serine/threonine-protein kinase [Actinoplanes sp. NPDC049596]|uniref:serine/threonine-protein kinase n=1 Tax=unclassified Actinoplanes TaxID=2626549 RepID=UPI0034276ABB
MTHRTGDVLTGRYRLDDRIAGGGMGEVWRATDLQLGRRVAVKTLRSDRAADAHFQIRFRDEARALAALDHPGVVAVYDYGQEAGGDAYLVMAQVDGQPLSHRLAERGWLEPAETMSIVAQVGRALQAAHDAGIVHRDVKPGNMIVQPDGSVVLVDFGVARSPGSAALTGAEEVVGTAYYISPEQVSKHPAGPASDVYSLGAVAFHCLAGHPPFQGHSPLTIALQHVNDDPPPLSADIPPSVRAVVSTAMAKDPRARFASAAAMAAAADRAAALPDPDDPTVTLRSFPASPPAAPRLRRPRRRPLVMVLALSLALVVSGVAVAVADPFGWFPRSPAPSTSAPASPPARATSESTAPPAGEGAGSGAATTAPPDSSPPHPAPATSRNPGGDPTTPGSTTTPTGTPPPTGTTALTATTPSATTATTPTGPAPSATRTSAPGPVTTEPAP